MLEAVGDAYLETYFGKCHELLRPHGILGLQMITCPDSRYESLNLQMTRRFSNGLQFIGAYTWSHNFDDSTATNFTTILSPRRGQDFQNVRGEWADSALDHRQRLTLTPVYEFNPFRQANWYVKNRSLIYARYSLNIRILNSTYPQQFLLITIL